MVQQEIPCRTSPSKLHSLSATPWHAAARRSSSLAAAGSSHDPPWTSPQIRRQFLCEISMARDWVPGPFFLIWKTHGWWLIGLELRYLSSCSWTSVWSMFQKMMPSPFNAEGLAERCEFELPTHKFQSHYSGKFYRVFVLNVPSFYPLVN